MTIAYEADIVAWAEQQADLLRTRNFAALDIEHIADEVADVGKSEGRELARRFVVLLARPSAEVARSAGAARQPLARHDQGAKGRDRRPSGRGAEPGSQGADRALDGENLGQGRRPRDARDGRPGIRLPRRAPLGAGGDPGSGFCADVIVQRELSGESPSENKT
jgi:hypothetical protein